MGIARYENLTINNVVNGVDTVGEYTTTIKPWFETRGLVHDINNSLRVSERYRVYSELVSMTFNYTPNIKSIVDDQNLFSITWRGKDWRIADVRETNDRMRATFICYYNEPSVRV